MAELFSFASEPDPVGPHLPRRYMRPSGIASGWRRSKGLSASGQRSSTSGHLEGRKPQKGWRRKAQKSTEKAPERFTSVASPSQADGDEPQQFSHTR